MVTANLTKSEKSYIKKICNLSEITHNDIRDCVNCYQDMIDSKEYRKAEIIKYALYTILKRSTSSKIISAVAEAIHDMTAFYNLFSQERWDM